MGMGTVGLVALADATPTPLAQERAAWIESQRRALADLLRGEGHEVAQPGAGAALASPEGMPAIAAEVARAPLDALVVLIAHWAEPRTAAALVQAMNVPTALFGVADARWGGSVGLLRCGEAVAAGAGKWGRLARRFLGDTEGLIAWLRGMAARGELRRGSVLMWGGPGEGRDDEVTVFRGRVVGEIYAEELGVLTERAERLVGSGAVKAMDKWLRGAGLEVKHDKEIFTKDVWERELALVVAARARLSEIGGEHPLLAVSVRCLPPLAAPWGSTLCALPTLLPFGEGPEGPVPVIPTISAGDVMSLLGAALLGRFGRRVPPLFGDVAHVGAGTIHVSSGGGLALWYAAQTHEARLAMKRTTVIPQCLGTVGGSWDFLGVDMDPVTVVQVGRRAGSPAVAVGMAKPKLVTAADRKRQVWGAPWPLVKITGGFEPSDFAAGAVSEHVLALPGEWVREVAAWAEAEGFETLEFGSFKSLDMA
jgi:L-fucose isomerase-like protein